MAGGSSTCCPGRVEELFVFVASVAVTLARLNPCLKFGPPSDCDGCGWTALLADRMSLPVSVGCDLSDSSAAKSIRLGPNSLGPLPFALSGEDGEDGGEEHGIEEAEVPEHQAHGHPGVAPWA